MKPERERSVCRAFLRALGVAFQNRELIAPTIEPTDVAFREAKFQVQDLLRGRKRGDDWKNKERKYETAVSLEECTEPSTSPVAIEFASLIPELAVALSDKAERYGVGCKTVDVLVYADLEGAFLSAASQVTNTDLLKLQGWRSVSLLFSPYSVVLFATADAPSFLRNMEGKVCMNWADIESLFNE